MSFLQRAVELANASTFISDEGIESFIKSASDSDITINDMNMAHNLTSDGVDLASGEGVVPEDEALDPSRLSGAVNLMVKQASIEPFSEDDAIAYLGEIGLTVDDYNEVYDYVPEDLIQKVANEMDGIESELTADDAVWEKIAEAHDFLVESGLDPVASLNFAADFEAADSEEAEDKVASEIEDLDGETVEKIAEAVNHLSGIEGIHPADLMAEWDKVAGAGETLKKGLNAMKKGLKGKRLTSAEQKSASRIRSAEENYGKTRAHYAGAGDTPNALDKIKNADKTLKRARRGGANLLKSERKKRLKQVGAIGAVGATGAAGGYAAS